MAIHLAHKYSEALDQMFTLASRTNLVWNGRYDFIGVNSISVWTIESTPMVPYDISDEDFGRFGKYKEVQDKKQDFKMTQDWGFAQSVDRRYNLDQMYIKDADTVVGIQMREQVIPMIDKYRLSTIAAAALPAGVTNSDVLDYTNSYEAVLKGQEYLDENLVPEEGRVIYATNEFFRKIMLDPNFIKQGDASQNITIRGFSGDIDGLPLIKVPKSYLPANTNFMILHPTCAINPVKIDSVRLHIDPIGLSGFAVDGRFYYDTFILREKAGCIYLSQSA